MRSSGFLKVVPFAPTENGKPAGVWYAEFGRVAITTVPDAPTLGPVLSPEFVSAIRTGSGGIGVLALSLHAYSITIEFPENAARG